MPDTARQTVYVETSVISYLTARPSTTIVGAALQQITRDWWRADRANYELRVSELVLLEAAAGDSAAAKQRLDALRGIALLEIDDTVRDIARDLVSTGCVPAKAAQDAMHIAIASAHAMDYMAPGISSILRTPGCRLESPLFSSSAAC